MSQRSLAGDRAPAGAGSSERFHVSVIRRQHRPPRVALDRGETIPAQRFGVCLREVVWLDPRGVGRSLGKLSPVDRDKDGAADRSLDEIGREQDGGIGVVDLDDQIGYLTGRFINHDLRQGADAAIGRVEPTATLVLEGSVGRSDEAIRRAGSIRSGAATT